MCYWQSTLKFDLPAHENNPHLPSTAVSCINRHQSDMLFANFEAKVELILFFMNQKKWSA